ncbi:Hypothetical protein NTJ_09502 [Nesidiocoris tenuis]|uniref:Uncharacterized protein n=1 Tax=Nesidiocoris tenuis TaxID=355587 RepID=A0ABN7AZD7_9HEMI|nr:Hypothetical protein NTJ_09502 [Nesidiocoris tenuis]
MTSVSKEKIVSVPEEKTASAPEEKTASAPEEETASVPEEKTASVPEEKIAAAPEENPSVPQGKNSPAPGEKGDGEPVKKMQIPNKEWDMCVQKAVKTVGLGVIVGAVLGAVVGADLPLMWGTGITVAWSIKRCRALLRDGIITPEMERERKRLQKIERERKKLEKLKEKELKDRDHECCRKLAELEELMRKEGRLDKAGRRIEDGEDGKSKLQQPGVDEENDKYRQQPGRRGGKFNDDQPRDRNRSDDDDESTIPDDDSTASNQQDAEAREDMDDEEPCDSTENDAVELEGECEEQNIQDENEEQIDFCEDEEELPPCEDDEENEVKMDTGASRDAEAVEEECEDEQEPDCIEPGMEQMDETDEEGPCEDEENAEESKLPPVSTRSYNSFLQHPSTSKTFWSEDALEKRRFHKANVQRPDQPIIVKSEGQLGFGKPKTTGASGVPLNRQGFKNSTNSIDEEECEEEEEDEGISEKTGRYLQ